MHQPGAAHLLFTDSDNVAAPPGWELLRVKPRFPTDPVRSARYLKIVGHPVLDEYDETLWIDNRVVLKKPASFLFELNRNYDLSIPSHSFRSSLTDEFSEVIAAGYDDPRKVREMFRIAAQDRLQNQHPLWTGILVRKRSPGVAECMRRWIELVLLTSRRDQLSVNVALADSQLRINIFELNNLASECHSWIPHRMMKRERSIQDWRPTREPIKIQMSDALRASSLGRKIARGLTKSGLVVPTLN